MRRAVRHQCPDRPGGLVGQGNRSDFLRPPGKQLDEPRALSTVPLHMADHGHGADYQHLAQIAVACPRDAAEPRLATARVLLASPGRHALAAPPAVVKEQILENDRRIRASARETERIGRNAQILETSPWSAAQGKPRPA